ncbi:DNA/RNA helicase, superfamily I [Mycobacteroides abscessus subsp. abscessus]|nr:DNA/RNA helicase, superfamily I [Mycobacteroides abscessus subsp. abscessus]
MPDFTPTAEQTHIADLFRDGSTLKVRAGAGTGKTSTLLLLADVLAEQNRLGLYVAFNKAIATEAGRKFGNHITAKTAHAMAFAGIRNTRHADLLDKMRGNRIPFWVTREQIGIRAATITGSDNTPRRLSAGAITKHALRTVDTFCTTADTDIRPEHVPTMPGIDWPGQRHNHRALIDIVLPYAKAVWRDLTDPRGTAVAFSHGHYLKLWAMEHPVIGRPGGALFIDEAQDISPVMADVFDRQTHLQRVVVGDSAQSIYGFTGAIDYMSTTPAEHEGRLTQSWRFGQAIADAANELLTELGDDLRLTGNPGRDSRIEPGLALADAILTRSNASALIHVMAAQRAGRPVCLMGDIKQSLAFCDGAEKLLNGERVFTGDLEAFESWAQVVEYAEEAPGASDWKVLVALIEEHTVNDVRNALSSTVPENQAEVIVSTAHKSKGREWGTVRLDSSLAESVEDAREREFDVLRDELMLAYVAVTRAQHVLDPSLLFDDAPTKSTVA